MLKGSGNRILPILAAVLVSVGLFLTLGLFLLRAPDGQEFNDALQSARLARESDDRGLMSRELLTASRYAVSAHNWKSLLSVAGASVASERDKDSYKLFTTLAGRAAAALPGDEDLRAFWIWGLLRIGEGKIAAGMIDELDSPVWRSLRTEVLLNTVVDGDSSDLEAYMSALNRGSDPEFFESAATLTGSAELGVDAALLFMHSSKPLDALDMARAVMDGELNWKHPESRLKNTSALGMAAIAQDNAMESLAIRWLEPSIAADRDRRALSWENLQLFGDLNWNRFLLTGDESSRGAASDAWREGMEIVRAALANDALPEGSWRLWINQSVLEESRGRIRESRRLLDEALGIYPGVHEVQASWSLEMVDVEPALARRLARTAYVESHNPVLGITAIRLDPETVSPRIYESKLWELFEAVTHNRGNLQDSDARIITTFLLEYMASRKNYASVDVAVERYLKAHPDGSWILSWRLAADASRGMGLIDLVAEQEGRSSPYAVMRTAAMREHSWRALHDSAMYGITTAKELEAGARRFGIVPSAATDFSSADLDAAVLAVLEPLSVRPDIVDSPAGDRLRILFMNRSDTERERNRMSSGSRRGRQARSHAAMVMLESAETLREDALEGLEYAVKISPNLSDNEMATLLYLKALVLKDLERFDESRETAAAVVDLDPDHARARELLSLEERI